MKKITTSVVICGAGPVGLTLAHLLGMDGIDCIVLDRLESTVTEPRAIAFDGESLRTLQKLDLLEGMENDFLCGLIADYVNGAGEHLFQVGRPEFRPYGYSLINAFDQPTLDRYLAEQLKDRETVDLRFNHVLTNFEQDESGIRVFCSNPEEGEIEISARYLIGCDGGRSTVRGLLNIEMQGKSNPQPWLVIDTKDKYLDDQLDCRFFCDPKRPGMTIRKRHGERRWEWMLMPGEEREYLLEDDTIRALISPYTQVDQVNVYRKRVYDFHAIIADRWRDGRVMLAGDAAHMTPPFAGQGLNSGLRDASNLSWKLAMVLKGQANAALLDTYELDRRDHAWELIQTALDLGEQIQPIDEALAAERDGFFAELNKDPDAIRALEDEMLKSVTERRVYPSLTIDSEVSDIPGRLLIQPTLRAKEAPVMLDDRLGPGFSIIGFNCDPEALLSEQERSRWRALGTELVRITSAPSELPDDTLFDDNDSFTQWLGGSDPVILLVRPDRFCMAYAQPGDVAVCFGKAYSLITHGH